MSIVINGTGTITGISQGGLNDNIITQAELATTGVAGNGPAFSAYPSANLPITQFVITKVVFNSEEFDTASCFSTVNSNFTPNVAGYYQISSAVAFQTRDTGESTFALYKNGTAYKTLFDSYGQWGVCGSALVYLNGTTDYIDVRVYVSSTGLALHPGPSLTYFTGELVRAG